MAIRAPIAAAIGQLCVRRQHALFLTFTTIQPGRILNTGHAAPMKSDPKESKLDNKTSRKKRATFCVGTGVALGIIFGAAFENVGAGLVLGAALGAAAEAAARKRTPKNKG